MCSIEIANQANHWKEYAVTTHRNVWYLYRYHQMLSNGTRGLVLPAYFELIPWGTFPVFTQRASCHFITRRFTYFYRTRTSGGFPRIYTVLSYCQHSPFPGNFFPHLLSHGARSGIAIFA